VDIIPLRKETRTVHKTYPITSPNLASIRFTSLNLALGLAALIAAAPAPAQAPSRQPVPKVSFAFGKAQDKQLYLDVEVELAPGWHINSTKPLDEFLVPTSLQVQSEGFEFAEQHWPKPDSVHSPAAGGYMSLYSGRFTVRIEAKPRKGKSAPGPAKVTLHYQSCDNATCFPPKSVTVER
jgi:thiol:disulfide interchange protein DsbD